jgi:hypothetical protein
MDPVGVPEVFTLLQCSAAWGIWKTDAGVLCNGYQFRREIFSEVDGGTPLCVRTPYEKSCATRLKAQFV